MLSTYEDGLVPNGLNLNEGSLGRFFQKKRKLQLILRVIVVYILCQSCKKNLPQTGVC